MRKNLEVVSVVALALLVGITARALYGPVRLPARIPTHFDAAGQVNGWGSPWSLLGLPAIGCALYLLMTLVARFPGSFNFPVRVTAGNRARLEALALNMIAWLKAEILCLFVCIQEMTVESALHGHGNLPVAFVPLSMVVIFATIGVHMVAMMRAGR